MNWSPSDVIAVVSIIASAGVAAVSVRAQRRADAIGRRRAAHLRTWGCAQKAIRAYKSWCDGSEGRDRRSVAVAVSELRESIDELQIISPAIAEQCAVVPALLELGLSRMSEADEMGFGEGDKLPEELLAMLRDYLFDAQIVLARMKVIMSNYDRRGTLIWWARASSLRLRLARWLRNR